MKVFSNIKIKTRLIMAFSIILLLTLIIAGLAAIQIFGYESLNLIDPAKALIFLTILTIFTGIFMMLSFNSSIVRQITDLAEIANEVSSGDLNVILKSDAKDELGYLKNALGGMINTINGLINELEFVTVAQSEGVTDINMNVKGYKGTYCELAKLINDMVMENNEITKKAIRTVFEIASGEFEAQAPVFPGDKAILNETIELLRSNIKTVYSQMSRLVGEAKQGKLGIRVDNSMFGGDWQGLMSELNALMDAMTNPINETISVLERVAAGDFKIRMSGSYQGDFHKIMDRVNFMANEIGEYISEISEVLHALSRGDFTGGIDREYIGDFIKLKESINQIVDNFNKDFNNMQSMAENLKTSTRQISEASIQLAGGATRQTESVNRLTNIIADFKKISEEIAKDTKIADDLLNGIDHDAKAGTDEMARLVSAMDEINQSSKSIATINRVIEDIAFQTNLLAINAAIEAARAGEAGKGFSVVAGEVRDLANRSGEASNETSVLIETSTERVSVGTRIAHSVSLMLNRVSEQISNTLAIMTEIASVSNSQTNSANQMNDVNSNTNDIIMVTMQNASASEQTAATAQELATQAELLNETLARYLLRA